MSAANPVTCPPGKTSSPGLCAARQAPCRRQLSRSAMHPARGFQPRPWRRAERGHPRPSHPAGTPGSAARGCARYCSALPPSSFSPASGAPPPWSRSESAFGPRLGARGRTCPWRGRFPRSWDARSPPLPQPPHDWVRAGDWGCGGGLQQPGGWPSERGKRGEGVPRRAAETLSLLHRCSKALREFTYRFSDR